MGLLFHKPTPEMKKKKKLINKCMQLIQFYFMTDFCMDKHKFIVLTVFVILKTKMKSLTGTGYINHDSLT